MINNLSCSIKLKLLLIILLVSNSFFSFASKNSPDSRIIELAGLIVNAKTMTPIESANIYDAANSILGSSDKNGYFKVKIDYTKSGEIVFKLKVVKKGYQTFIQTEHWGNLAGLTSNIIYFGLGVLEEKAKGFSDLNTSGDDLSYESVLSGFSKLRLKQDFALKLELAKTGNENVFLPIDGKFYLVDNTGWIQLNADKDLISIDDKQFIPADKINSVLKRKSIKWMSTVSDKKAKFAVHTR